jgi:hypothetical protein
MSGSHEKNARRIGLGILLTGLAGLAARSVIGAEPAMPSAPDFSGVWRIEAAPGELRPADGSPLPLTAWAKQTYNRNKSELRQGKITFDLTRERCSSPGAVRMMTLPYAVEFFQRPQQLTLLFEWNHLYRIVNLRETPKVAPYPLAIGVSNGHWEGSTLVVETTDVIDNTELDSSGLPHSDQLQVVERFRLLDDGRLEDVMTLHDPKAFTRDWSATLRYKKTAAQGVREDVCLDRLDAGQPAIAQRR